MAAISDFLDANKILADRINKEVLANPHSPFVGKFVAIVSGQVAAVAENLDDLIASVGQLEKDPAKIFCLEAGLDYSRVHEIWSQ